MTCTNHKCTRIIPLVITRLFSPNCPLVVAVQCASRQGHTHAMRRMCVRVVHAYTQHTCPRLARIFSCTRAYTCHHNDTLQFRAGAPLALREDPTSRRRDPLLLLFFLRWAAACGPTFLVQYQGTPCRARRAEQSSFEVTYFKEAPESRRFSAFRDRGSGIDRLIFREKLLMEK